MRSTKLALTLAIGLLAACSEPGPTGRENQAAVSSGKLETIADFPSAYLPARDVQVWLPGGYSPDRKYAVLYMHDGQMLFDATVTWNKQEWGVDEAASKLMAEGKVRDFIVVGVFNGGDRRHAEYLPEKPYRMLAEDVRKDLYGAEGEELAADEYLKFLVTELKPYIDSHYATLPSPEDTAVMGSNMGGLISMYAIAEYPDVFGMAACLSTHWPGFDPEKVPEMTDTFIAYMRATLPTQDGHKLYFDYGDQTLDAYYPPVQAKVDAMMADLGWDEAHWRTVYDKGADHSEVSWQKRLPGIMTFLFGK